MELDHAKHRAQEEHLLSTVSTHLCVCLEGVEPLFCGLHVVSILNGMSPAASRNLVQVSPGHIQSCILLGASATDLLLDGVKHAETSIYRKH